MNAMEDVFFLLSHSVAKVGARGDKNGATEAAFPCSPPTWGSSGASGRKGGRTRREHVVPHTMGCNNPEKCYDKIQMLTANPGNAAPEFWPIAEERKDAWNRGRCVAPAITGRPNQRSSSLRGSSELQKVGIWEKPMG